MNHALILEHGEESDRKRHQHNQPKSQQFDGASCTITSLLVVAHAVLGFHHGRASQARQLDPTHAYTSRSDWQEGAFNDSNTLPRKLRSDRSVNFGVGLEVELDRNSRRADFLCSTQQCFSGESKTKQSKSKQRNPITTIGINATNNKATMNNAEQKS